MRKNRSTLTLAALVFSALLPTMTGAAHAQSVERRPYMAAAQSAFYSLSYVERMEMHFLLIATGDFNAMVSDKLGGRLYDATISFQHAQGMPETGALTPDVVARLRAIGGPILTSWGMHFVNHPAADATLGVPGRFGLIASQTQRGLAFENGSHTFSVAFAFFPDGDASMAELYSHLTAPAVGRRIDMKVIRPDFFAVAGGGEKFGTYSRYIAIPGGSVGFTVTWNTDFFPNGSRVAVVMANQLLPQRYVPNAVANAPAAAPDPVPSQPAALEAPKAAPSTPVIVTGSAFYVTTDGDLVTNNHVVKGCDGAIVVRHGAAKIVARDNKNDLALLHLVARPEAGTVRPVSFRSAPIQLGEAVYVLGYPYAGALDNGVNFTNGMVSSVAGMDNDSTRFQLTAPVQPGNSGGPVLDQSGNLIGIVVARMSDVAAMNATNTVPQNVNFGIKGEVAASFLRANNVSPAMGFDASALPTTQLASAGQASTAQIVCSRIGGDE